MTEKTPSERQFKEAGRRASERYKKRRAGIDAVWRRANQSPSYAHRAVLTLAAKARHELQQGRRTLYARFGVEAPSNEDGTVFAYPIVRPEHSPRNPRGRMLRAEAVIQHAEAGCVWRAARKGAYPVALVPPRGGRRMACKFVCKAMRQAPALWAFFMENERDQSICERALVDRYAMSSTRSGSITRPPSRFS